MIDIGCEGELHIEQQLSQRRKVFADGSKLFAFTARRVTEQPLKGTRDKRFPHVV